MKNRYYSIQNDCNCPEHIIDKCCDELEEEFAEKNKSIATVEITETEDEYIFKASELSPIRRTRRITGYLSDITNFNPSKRQEADDRHKHM